MPQEASTSKKWTPHPDENLALEWGPSNGPDHERRMAKFFGLRPHPKNLTVSRCPRIVAGKRCLLGFGKWGFQSCICRRYASHLWDHTNLWRDKFNRNVLTVEPYGINAEELAPLISDVAALGLEVDIEGYSPWFPGHTVLIVIRPQRAPAPQP